MAMQINSEVLREGESFYNWTHNKTQRPLHMTDEKISHGLVHRLAAYSLKALDDAGFKPAVVGWACTVYTLDGNERPADREYTVRFQNPKGGYLEVNRIFTRNGWPFLDHGISAGHE